MSAQGLDYADPLIDESDTVRAMSRNMDESTGSGSVLIAIESLRREMNDRLDSLKNDVAQISSTQSRSQANLTELSVEVRAGLRNITAATEELVGTREVKGRRCPRQALQLLPYAAGFDRAVAPLLKWSIIVTVVSFVRKTPSLKFWVSNSMWSKMEPYAEILDNSQGFPMLLFSAKNNSKAKLATPPGRLWTFLLRRTLRTVLLSAKAELFQKAVPSEPVGSTAQGSDFTGADTSGGPSQQQSASNDLPIEPEWMSGFKDGPSIIRAVDKSMQKFEGSSKDVSISSATADSVSGGPRSRPKKRKKVANYADTELEHRMYVVKQIRTMWLDKMNNGRTAARAYLYKSLIFILDKIAQFKDVDRARQRGYKIELHKEASDTEEIDSNSPNLKNTIWNIPDACVGDNHEADSRNNQHLEDLKEKFPSLRATITYKKQIETDANEADPLFNATRRTEFVNLTQDVRFHDVGIEMIMEIHSCDNRAAILSMSQLSLKAVHVIAIALRGLVIQILDQWRRPLVGLSAVETAAVGSEVTLDDEKKVAVMMERRLKSGNISDTYNACYKDKFYATEAEAEVLRRTTDALRPQMVAPVHAREPQAPLSDLDLGDEGVEDWIHKK